MNIDFPIQLIQTYNVLNQKTSPDDDGLSTQDDRDDVKTTPFIAEVNMPLETKTESLDFLGMNFSFSEDCSELLPPCYDESGFTNTSTDRNRSPYVRDDECKNSSGFFSFGEDDNIYGNDDDDDNENYEKASDLDHSNRKLRRLIEEEERLMCSLEDEFDDMLHLALEERDNAKRTHSSEMFEDDAKRTHSSEMVGGMISRHMRQLLFHEYEELEQDEEESSGFHDSQSSCCSIFITKARRFVS